MIDRSAGTAPSTRPVIAPLFGPASTPEAARPDAPEALGVPPLEAAHASAPTEPPPRFDRDAPAHGSPRAAAAPETAHETRPGARAEAQVQDGTPPPQAAALRTIVRPPSPSEPAMLPARAAAELHDVAPRVDAPPQAPPVAPETPPDRVLPAVPMQPVRLPPRAAERGRSTMDEGPVVVVKIGRIEVRAQTPPAAPAPRPTRRPAAVSLEEYLRPKRRDR